MLFWKIKKATLTYIPRAKYSAVQWRETQPVYTGSGTIESGSARSIMHAPFPLDYLQIPSRDSTSRVLRGWKVCTQHLCQWDQHSGVRVVQHFKRKGSRAFDPASTIAWDLKLWGRWEAVVSCSYVLTWQDPPMNSAPASVLFRVLYDSHHYSICVTPKMNR